MCRAIWKGVVYHIYSVTSCWFGTGRASLGVSLAPWLVHRFGRLCEHTPACVPVSVQTHPPLCPSACGHMHAHVCTFLITCLSVCAHMCLCVCRGMYTHEPGRPAHMLCVYIRFCVYVCVYSSLHVMHVWPCVHLRVTNASYLFDPTSCQHWLLLIMLFLKVSSLATSSVTLPV